MAASHHPAAVRYTIIYRIVVLCRGRYFYFGFSADSSHFNDNGDCTCLAPSFPKSVIDQKIRCHTFNLEVIGSHCTDKERGGAVLIVLWRNSCDIEPYYCRDDVRMDVDRCRLADIDLFNDDSADNLLCRTIIGLCRFIFSTIPLQGLPGYQRQTAIAHISLSPAVVAVIHRPLLRRRRIH